MKVIEHISNSNNTQFSYEIIPPLRGKGDTNYYRYD